MRIRERRKKIEGERGREKREWREVGDTGVEREMVV
jgi:hypothetical protein